MLVVLLRDLARIHIILGVTVNARYEETRRTYLNNLLVGHAGEKDVLFVIVGVEADDVGGLAVAEALETLASLGVP